jgi:hypothetical protein
VAFAQRAQVSYQKVDYDLYSEVHSGDGDRGRMVFERVINVPGARWLRLVFADYELDKASHVFLLAGEDGGYQVLNTRSMAEWSGGSAVFNGDSVIVQLFVAPGDKGVFFLLDHVLAGGESPLPSGTTAFDAAHGLAAGQPVLRTQDPVAYPNMYRTFELSLGVAAYDNFDTTMQVEGAAGAGAVVDLENVLNLEDDRPVFRADMFYRFSPRHRINLSYYDIGRSGIKTVEEDRQIGDVVFPAGSEVETTLDTTIVKLSYQYNFVTDQRTAIGASFGFHTMAIGTEFETTSGDIRESFDATAPLPVLGLHAEYALSPTWKLLASAELFQIELGDFGGFLSDNRLSIENDLFENVGWGLGFNGFTLDASVEGNNGQEAELEYAFQGLMLYLRVIL